MAGAEEGGLEHVISAQIWEHSIALRMEVWETNSRQAALQEQRPQRGSQGWTGSRVAWEGGQKVLSLEPKALPLGKHTDLPLGSKLTGANFVPHVISVGS